MYWCKVENIDSPLIAIHCDPFPNTSIRMENATFYHLKGCSGQTDPVTLIAWRGCIKAFFDESSSQLKNRSRDVKKTFHPTNWVSPPHSSIWRASERKQLKRKCIGFDEWNSKAYRYSMEVVNSSRMLFIDDIIC